MRRGCAESALKPIVCIALCALALACADRKSPGATATAQPAVSADAPSIYPLAVSLRDEHDQAIALDVDRGHATIIAMFYGTCPVACPLIVSHVKEIESRLSPHARAEMRVLLVSFDPTHDTPDALAAIASARGLDLTRWTLASGADDDVRQIAAALGVSYRPLPSGGFAHDSIITALDRDGRPVARTDDPSADLTPLVVAISRE